MGVCIAFPPSGFDATLLTIDGTSATSECFMEPGDIRAWRVFSPDGRWLAYGSDASGRDEVYVRPYPGPGPARQVSVEGDTVRSGTRADVSGVPAFHDGSLHARTTAAAGRKGDRLTALSQRMV